MVTLAWRRLRRKAEWLPVARWFRWIQPLSTSYERLPTSTRWQDAVVLASPHKCSWIYILFILLVVTGVSAGVIKSSSSDLMPLSSSLFNATIETLSKDLTRGKFTSVDLVKAYLARIAEVNGELHAVTETNPDALIIAHDLDRERSKGSVRGPLHGIPLLIKDNIATNDKMNNTAGSYALLGARVPQDSTVAQKLRSAGAIILGKTSMTEWAYMRSLNFSNGWSARAGQVYNPYFLSGDPEGSSSGSSVASALGLASGSLGTETDGSILLPASFNNIVGIKPTVGLTSRYLVIPLSQHQDTVGAIARTVKDATYILQAIAGTDTRDNYTSAIPNGTVPDYIKACNPAALSGARIGIPRNVFTLLANSAAGPILEAFEQALDVMRTAGAIIIEDTNFTAAEEYLNSDFVSQRTIINADFVVDLQDYLESLTYNPHSITTLAELRNFTQTFPLENYPTRDTKKWDSALSQSWNNTSPEFWPAYQRYLYYGNEGGLLGTLKRHKLDAVALPTLFASTWAALVGAPAVTVPMGSYPDGVPVVKDSWGLAYSAPNIPFGISLLGAKFSEPTLIGLAYAFEQRTKIRDRITPYIIPKAELADVVSGQMS